MSEGDDREEPKAGAPASPQKSKDMNIKELLLCQSKDIIFSKEQERFIAQCFKSRGIDGILKDIGIESESTRSLMSDLITKEVQLSGPSHPPQPSKVFNEPTHGHIELEYPLVKIIDTLVFQRLRHIKQLGCTYEVFPGASHNCFEHALGVCYVVGKIVRTLQTECGNKFHISYKDALCVKIAGLCYNLGRGPFANVFDDLCKNELKVPEWNFEDASVTMFDLLMEENPELRAMLRDQHDIEDEDIERIRAMIKGDHSMCSAAKEDRNRFLYHIVVNKETRIDAETMDSIARDSRCVGIHTSSDYERLVKFVRVSVPDGEKHAVLCYNDKESRDLYDTLLSRVILSQRAYQHKTVRVIELLLKESLRLADPLLQLRAVARDLIGDDKKLALAAAAKFKGLTDTITERIEHPGCCIEKRLMSSEEQCPCTKTLGDKAIADLKESQELLKKIHKRELPKLVGQAIYDTVSHIDSVETVKEPIKKFIHNGKVTEDDIFIDVVVFRFGTEESENPIEDIYMYSKASKDKLFKVKRENVSSLLPEKFTEHIVRVYSRNRDPQVTAEVKKKFKEFVVNREGWTYIDSTYVGHHRATQSESSEATGSEEP